MFHAVGIQISPHFNPNRQDVHVDFLIREGLLSKTSSHMCHGQKSLENGHPPTFN